jgi:electron-transferring-flavoprotein dehydrogenase
MLAAEAIFANLKRGEPLESYEQAIEVSSVGQELYQVRNARQAFQKGFVKGSLLAGPAIMSKGKVPRGRQHWNKGDQVPQFIGDTNKGYPKPDGKYTFDKLSSVYISGNATRDDAPNHIRLHRNVPREVAESWVWMCPAGVYEIPEDAPEKGNVDVTVNYTNCVQCGAITARGGRLTPPEGGDGPLYQLT